MRKNLLRLGKIFLSAGIIAVIFRYFLHFENLKEVGATLSNTSVFIFLLAIFIASVNWGIESRKWQILMENLEFLSFGRSVKSTLAGATVSNILPFRIGEYLGRIVFIRPENHIPAVFNSVLGSSTQFIVSLALGIPSAYFILDKKHLYITNYAALSILLIVVVFAILFYFFRKKTKSPKKWIQKLGDDIRKFKTLQILHVFWLSLLRYAVFSTFYAFLFIHFQVTDSFATAWCSVASVYMLQGFAPSMIVTDAGLRTALPLFVFQAEAALEAPILTAALINYFFNILLPSLTGLFFIIVQKIKSR